MIAINFCQCLFVIHNYNLRWPRAVTETLSAMSVFHASMNTFTFECGLPHVAYNTRWLLVTSIPLLGLLMTVLAFAVGALLLALLGPDTCFGWLQHVKDKKTNLLADSLEMRPPPLILPSETDETDQTPTINTNEHLCPPEQGSTTTPSTGASFSAKPLTRGGSNPPAQSSPVNVNAQALLLRGDVPALPPITRRTNAHLLPRKLQHETCTSTASSSSSSTPSPSHRGQHLIPALPPPPPPPLPPLPPITPKEATQDGDMETPGAPPTPPKREAEEGGKKKQLAASAPSILVTNGGGDTKGGGVLGLRDEATVMPAIEVWGAMCLRAYTSFLGIFYLPMVPLKTHNSRTPLSKIHLHN